MQPMEAAVTTDKREALLDAALRVVAAQGLRGLTHRAVEAEADLPHGSTTYYFGTRRDLTVALMAHIADTAQKDVVPIARTMTMMLADRSREVDIDVICDGLLGWLDSHSEMELARYELQISAARDPEMLAIATSICDQFRVMCEPIVLACGSKDVQRDSAVVQEAIDGWMFAHLTKSDASEATFKRGIRLLLDGIGSE
jgi:DNA-binding transcriptional regulator YbjK